MSHAEAEYRRGVVFADFLLLGVEAHTLRYVSVAGEAEDAERHFKAHGLGAAMDSRGLFFVKLVAGVDAFLVRGDVASGEWALVL